MKVIMGTRQSGGHLTSQVGSDIWDFIGERDSTQSLYSFKILEVSLSLSIFVFFVLYFKAIGCDIFGHRWFTCCIYITVDLLAFPLFIDFFLQFDYLAYTTGNIYETGKNVLISQ